MHVTFSTSRSYYRYLICLALHFCRINWSLYSASISSMIHILDSCLWHVWLLCSVLSYIAPPSLIFSIVNIHVGFPLENTSAAMLLYHHRLWLPHVAETSHLNKFTRIRINYFIWIISNAQSPHSYSTASMQNIKFAAGKIRTYAPRGNLISTQTP